MLRVKLTLWYVGALAAILVAFSVAFYMLLAQGLRERLDSGLRSAAQVTALALNHETEEHLGKLPGEENVRLVLNTMHQTSFPRPDISVWDGDRLVAEKPGLAGIPAREIGSRVMPSTTAEASFSTVLFQRARYRVVSARVWVPSSKASYVVLASESQEGLEAELLTVLKILALIVPLSLIGAAAGGYVLARRSLVPVLEMAGAAEQISSRNLSHRLPVGNSNDELTLLAKTFNRLFERLHSAFNEGRQFMADASHELRTPVSVALTATQVSLENRTGSPDSLYETLEVVQTQMLRLRRVVEDMFTLAQADSGSYRLDVSLFYLDEAVLESVRAGRVLGNAKSVEVVLDSSVGEASFAGDEGLIHQLLLILIDNAVKYTAPCGTVQVKLRSVEEGFRIEVHDTGCGIPLEDQGRIFNRFYRVDKSRSRRNPGAGSGAGLGLSIARWIVELHHGQIFLDQSSSKGSVFVVILPRASDLLTAPENESRTGTGSPLSSSQSRITRQTVAKP